MTIKIKELKNYGLGRPDICTVIRISFDNDFRVIVKNKMQSSKTRSA
jgi:hypothetical protein